MPCELELCWGTARGAALPELITVAAASGYRSIAVRPSMYYDALAEGFTDGDLRARLDDAGVVVGIVDPLTAGLPGIPPATDVPAAMRTFLSYGEDDCYTAAHGLAAPVVNIAHFMGGPQPAGRLAAALDLCRSVGAPNLGIMFDTWHFFRSGGTLADLADLPPGVVFAAQVSDATVDALGPTYVPMMDRLLPGQGTLPLVAILTALVANHPDLRIGVEVFRQDLRRMGPDQAARTVADAIGPIIEQVAGGPAAGGAGPAV